MDFKTYASIVSGDSSDDEYDHENQHVRFCAAMDVKLAILRSLSKVKLKVVSYLSI
jgi:hypothetical protein